MRELPPLNALKAFDASARHLNFTKAAAELNVSQGAVSRHIQHLEEYYNVTLFKRLYHQLELTPTGQMLAEKAVDMFDGLESVSHQLHQQEAQEIPLHIDGQMTFTVAWLIPRLKAFTMQQPTITPHVVVGDGVLDFATSEADVALRLAWQHDPYPNSYTQGSLLFPEIKIPVCSPALYSRFQDVGLDIFLKEATLLQHSTAPNMWPDLFALKRITSVDPNAGYYLEHVFMLIEAAKSSLGVTILPKLMIERELRDGSLIPFLPDEMATGRGHYLMYPKNKVFHPGVKAFRAWILGALSIS